MSNAKTGGNKKRASPSDEKYQARRKMASLGEINKAKSHARHNKRMGLDPKYAGNLTSQGGKAPHSRPTEKPRSPLLMRG